jgi:hypothetical protein
VEKITLSELLKSFPTAELIHEIDRRGRNLTGELKTTTKKPDHETLGAAPKEPPVATIDGQCNCIVCQINRMEVAKETPSTATTPSPKIEKPSEELKRCFQSPHELGFLRFMERRECLPFDGWSLILSPSLLEKGADWKKVNLTLPKYVVLNNDKINSIPEGAKWALINFEKAMKNLVGIVTGLESKPFGKETGLIKGD